MNKSSNSTKTSKSESITKLHNYQIKIKKVFTILNAIIKDMENKDSELTNSEEDGNENSHLQFEGTDWLQGVYQTTGVLQKNP